MKQLRLQAALLAVSSLCAPGVAFAAGFDQFIAFGDSTIDSGYFRYNPTGIPGIDSAVASAVANGASGAFVGPGVMNTTMLAGRFGLSAAPVGDGGTNFANGGAHTLIDVPPNVPAVQCITNYLSSVNGVANSHGLYEIRTGDNDLAFVAKQGAVWIAANPDYLSGIASTLSAQVAVLQKAGARTILVPNSYNRAIFAGPGGDIAGSNAASYARSVSFDATIWSDLTAAGVNFIPADIDSVMNYVVKNPTLFGFTPASVLSANAPSPTSALLTTTSMISSAQEQTYLFVDALHLTTAGQQIESDYEYSLVTAPGQISLLVESIAQVGLARAATIQRRIDFPGQQRQPDRVATWVDAGAGSLNLKNAPGFPEESSTPFGSTAGVDYQTPGGVIVGAALSAGDQRLRFSTGGHCTQVDEAPSLYVAYQTGPVWGNAIATYELIQDHIARQVPLGTFTDQNNADTRGQSVALALRGGEDFSLGRITTGPVAGVVWQQTHLNGFTETGTSGATALSFGSQTRDLLVSQLGWRGSTSVGRWQLLAEVEWNHDWAGKNREVIASLTSVAAAPYTIAAAPVAEDWATASLGTAYKLNSRTTLQAAVSAVIGNSRAASYGGDLSLSIGF